MLKDKIKHLCELKKITVKTLSFELGVSEPTIYRWFKDDSMEIKYLRVLAEYFGVDLTYFFSDQEARDMKEFDTSLKFKRVDISLQEKNENYQSMKDKYIDVLEENAKLLRENSILRDKLARYEANEAESKQNKAG